MCENLSIPFLLQQYSKNGKPISSTSGKKTVVRDDRQCRTLYLKCGMVTQTEGSAYAEMGTTKVVGSVIGPRELQRRDDFRPKGTLKCQVKFAKFSHQNRLTVEDLERDYSNQVASAVEPAIVLSKYPKTLIEIHLLVLENDGSTLAACILCASLALADAGIELYDMLTAVSVRTIGDRLIVDPAGEEATRVEEAGTALITVAYMARLHQTTLIDLKGDTSVKVVLDASKLAVDLCHQIDPLVQQALLDIEQLDE